MRLLLGVLPLAALGFLAAALLYLAPRKPGYSHVRHSISELGETGAPDQQLVAYGVFLPIGLVFAFVALVLREHAQAAALAASVAAGYVVAAFFPCDPGSPMQGSVRQGVHNVGGAVEYVGGGFSLMALSESLGPILRYGGFVVLVAVAALTFLASGSSVRGLVQRVAECVLFVAIAWVAWVSSAG